MGNFESKIEEFNRNAVKRSKNTEKSPEAETHVGKFEQTVDKVKSAVLAPFEKIKAGIEASKEAKLQKKGENLTEVGFQNACTEQYKDYIAKAEESENLVGTVETKTGEKGEQIETVYTEHGPIIKTQISTNKRHYTRYEGLSTLQINGADQLVYVNIDCQKSLGINNSSVEGYSGIVRDPNGHFTEDAAYMSDGKVQWGSKELISAFNTLETTHTAVCEAFAATTQEV